MVTVIAILVIVVALGVASALGRTADTRDRAFGAGRLLDPRARGRS